MNKEICDRLIQLRKEHGYSQEDLADKLNVSRQAVSKWERNEASPDTDNLIALSKLYGISLDELLYGSNGNDKKDSVHIGIDGIHVEDKNSSVHIGFNGIHVDNHDGDVIDVSTPSEMHNLIKPKFRKLSSILSSILFVFSIIGYILLGVFLDMWAFGWVVILIPEIITSFIRCFEKKDPGQFNMAFLALFIFIFVCGIYPATNLWHPMWCIFLLIPAFYTTTSLIKKHKDD